jgi:hypothetical protein
VDRPYYCTATLEAPTQDVTTALQQASVWLPAGSLSMMGKAGGCSNAGRARDSSPDAGFSRPRSSIGWLLHLTENDFGCILPSSLDGHSSKADTILSSNQARRLYEP